MTEHDMWEFERECAERGLSAVCGCDEAGAGPLAGPVYAAAVILPLGADIPGLNDSKKINREEAGIAGSGDQGTGPCLGGGPG